MGCVDGMVLVWVDGSRLSCTTSVAVGVQMHSHTVKTPHNTNNTIPQHPSPNPTPHNTPLPTPHHTTTQYHSPNPTPHYHTTLPHHTTHLSADPPPVPPPPQLQGHVLPPPLPSLVPAHVAVQLLLLLLLGHCICSPAQQHAVSSVCEEYVWRVCVESV